MRDKSALLPLSLSLVSSLLPPLSLRSSQQTERLEQVRKSWPTQTQTLTRTTCVAKPWNTFTDFLKKMESGTCLEGAEKQRGKLTKLSIRLVGLPVLRVVPSRFHLYNSLAQPRSSGEAVRPQLTSFNNPAFCHCFSIAPCETLTLTLYKGHVFGNHFGMRLLGMAYFWRVFFVIIFLYIFSFRNRQNGSLCHSTYSVIWDRRNRWA